jgi:hypothetical protein
MAKLDMGIKHIETLHFCVQLCGGSRRARPLILPSGLGKALQRLLVLYEYRDEVLRRTKWADHKHPWSALLRGQKAGIASIVKRVGAFATGKCTYMSSRRRCTSTVLNLTVAESGGVCVTNQYTLRSL